MVNWEIIEASDFSPIFKVFDTGYNQLDNTGVISSQFVDPNLTWEKTSLLNFGTEFTLIEGKLKEASNTTVKNP